MPESGLFITLFDEDTLKLYLRKGVYGFHMNPEPDADPRSRVYYRALADYACARPDSHVFFFLERKIYYGGSIIGPSAEFASFYLNGQQSPMGRNSRAPLAWDESNRSAYGRAGEGGLFTRPNAGQTTEYDSHVKCQPFVIRFADRTNCLGRFIVSDDLYEELGMFEYPLPMNSISDMSFCTMTPGETSIVLRLIQESSNSINPGEDFCDDVDFLCAPQSFDPSMGIPNMGASISESHLEFSVISNPSLLPSEIRPGNASICRQVPISPFKPSQMDRADICYYSADGLRDGTIPNTVIELKNQPAGMPECRQIQRYARWLRRRLGSDSEAIAFYLVAPSFRRTARIDPEYVGQITLMDFDAHQVEGRGMDSGPPTDNRHQTSLY